jgi:hypothetical protein
VKYSLLFHCNNSFTNGPQYYVIRILPVLFYVQTDEIVGSTIWLSSSRIHRPWLTLTFPAGINNCMCSRKHSAMTHPAIPSCFSFYFMLLLHILVVNIIIVTSYSLHSNQILENGRSRRSSADWAVSERSGRRCTCNLAFRHVRIFASSMFLEWSYHFCELLHFCEL